MLLEERPLHRQVIYGRLKAKDIHVGGKDSLGNLSAYLSNDSRFATAGRGQWTLAEPLRIDAKITDETKERFINALRNRAEVDGGSISFTEQIVDLAKTVAEEGGWECPDYMLTEIIRAFRQLLDNSDDWIFQPPDTYLPRINISAEDLAPAGSSYAWTRLSG